MNDLLNSLHSKFQPDTSVLSVSVYRNSTAYASITDGFDILVLVVAADAERAGNLFHYSKEDCRIQERWFSRSSLELGIVSVDNRNLIQWILRGEIVVDKTLYLEGLRHRLLEMPEVYREQHLLLEFAAFLGNYSRCKEYLHEEQLLDAYNNVLAALQHWARIVIIEQGQLPEVTIWEQVRRTNIGVYKLYEELTQSKETLKQRIELVLLACEFSVMSKMESCCSIILRLLGSRDDAWSVGDIRTRPELQGIDVPIPLLLNKLVKKGLLREMAYMTDERTCELEIRYTLHG